MHITAMKPLFKEVTDKLIGQTIVIKIGGSTLRSEKTARTLCADIAEIVALGARVVLVHGGGPAISKKLDEAGKECRYVDGLRVTDDEVLTIATEVLGSINDAIVNELAGAGVDAVGIKCGTGGDTLTARKKWVVAPSGARLDIGWVGETAHVDTEALETLMSTAVPVVASVLRGADGQLYNVNADNVAMAIAVALSASKLVYLTDVAGIMLDDDAVMSELPVDEVGILIDSGIVRGGMIPKLRSCAMGIRQGVESIFITMANAPGELLSTVLYPGTRGTVLSAGNYALERTA